MDICVVCADCCLVGIADVSVDSVMLVRYFESFLFFVVLEGNLPRGSLFQFYAARLCGNLGKGFVDGSVPYLGKTLCLGIVGR